MERLASLHANLLFTILIVLIIALIWSGVAALAARPMSRGLTSLLWIAGLLIAAECAIGVVLLSGGLQPARLELHVIYGVVALGALPAAARYTRDHLPRTQQLTFALTCLFLVAIVLRALETAQP
jgi:uncharacterized membrane protein YfhO